MVFITGDCHGNFRRFGRRYFPERETMSRDDYIIVAGDFSGGWADTPEEAYWLDWLDWLHDNRSVDQKHILLWEQIVQIL